MVIPPQALEIIIKTCEDNLRVDEEMYNYITKSRGITDETIKSWRIGSLPTDPQKLWNLYENLDGYHEETYSVIRYTSGFLECDFINNRFIVPISDQYGSPIGLVGRTLATEQEQKEFNIVKYLTTSYKKASQIFGFDRAIDTIIKTNECILVEGTLDVVVAHQYGIKNIGGVGNANVSSAQLALAARYAENIFIGLDDDEAGKKAHARLKKLVPPLAKELGVNIDFFEIKGAKDIDELLRKGTRSW